MSLLPCSSITPTLSQPIQTRATTNPKPYTVLKFMFPSRKGNLQEAFRSFTALFSDTRNLHLLDSDDVFAPLLELCAISKAASRGRQIHAHMIKHNVVSSSVFLSTKLVFMYGKCGSISDAEKVFEEMFERNVFTWNSMIGAYASNEEPLRALELYRRMRVFGVPFDSCTLTCVLKACGAVEDIRCGSEIHGLAFKCGYDSSVFVSNSLVAMYAKCNDIDRARKIFEGMNERSDVVSWNSVISAFAINGPSIEALRLFREMRNIGVLPSTYTYVAALQACKDSSFRELGMEIHASILKSNQLNDVYVHNALISMYVRIGKMRKAAVIFYKLHKKDDVTWNSLLTGFIQHGLFFEALQFFYKMQEAGLKPDQVSLISIIAASGRLGYLLNGKEIHAYTIKIGLDSNSQVGNTIIDMYAKCCCMTYAGRAFAKITCKDFISWTTIIAGYARNDCYIEALELSRQVLINGMELDANMIGSILLACSGLKCFLKVKEIHGFSIRHGRSDLVLQNSIVDAYGECGNINYAARIFESIEWKDVVSWTSMISSYVHNGLAIEALEVFYTMIDKGIEPDSITLLSLLSSTSSLSTMRKGKEIHGYIVRKGLIFDDSLSNALMDMYARCGNLEEAYKIFTGTRSKSLLLWTTMINAYGLHGHGKEAIELFYKMEEQRVSPDHITFLALLYACSHSGLTHDGKRFIQIMKSKYQLEPWPEHYVCLVDLLGRANHLEDAYHFVKSMRIAPTAEIWCALLGACRVHSNKELGEIAAQKLLDLNLDNAGNYVLVSNVFAARGKWDDVEDVRLRMKGSGLKKNPGCSWIEVGNQVHTFLARDKSHPESSKIYQKLGQIIEKLKREGGYVANTKFVFHNVAEEEKVQMLYGHSERLAITYGLLATADGTTIRISKNLRVCGDCHNFCKLVSKFFGRKLVMRDANRFHHFDGGVCSCGDFW
ncbi:hypothetical protein K2173_025708 [Erythroxylum novogranatense]|uniref:DYW domain-containing protein n=1 Tax=Erythroxylum novogranatense TaxID=1862640 RepID=A0AAV8SBS9_9ROSI|nr:hypothetical protein K2173_025708 [Erythroxylum novogranatense]